PHLHEHAGPHLLERLLDGARLVIRLRAERNRRLQGPSRQAFEVTADRDSALERGAPRVLELRQRDLRDVPAPLAELDTRRMRDQAEEVVESEPAEVAERAEAERGRVERGQQDV